MEAEFVSRAMAAVTSLAGALDLPVNDAVVIHNSNKLALRLLPCDVFARVASGGQEVAVFEVELAQRLAATESPVAALEPRVLLPGSASRPGLAGRICTRTPAPACGDAKCRDRDAALHGTSRSG